MARFSLLKSTTVLFLLIISTHYVVSAEEDDPLADLEDPLEEEEAAETILNQQQQQQQQRQPPPQPQGLTDIAKAGWAIVLGGVLWKLVRNWSSSSSASQHSRPTRRTPERTPQQTNALNNNMKHIKTQAEFDQIVSTTRVVLVDYGADWCKPCQEIKPLLARIAEDMTLDTTISFIVAEIDCDKCSDDLGNGIKTLPTFRVYVDGAITGEFEGATGLTQARRTARKAMQALKEPNKSSLSSSRPSNITEPRSKTPPRNSATIHSKPVSSSASSSASSTATTPPPLIASAVQIDQQYKNAIESMIQSHRNATGQQQWKCTQVLKIDPTDFDLHAELILCCGEMCTKKKFTVAWDGDAASSSSSSATTTSTSPADPSVALPASPSVASPKVVAFLNNRTINVKHQSKTSTISRFNLPRVQEPTAKAPSSSSVSSSSSSSTPPGQPLHLRSMEEFTSLVSEHPSVPIIVDFGASWCGPCRSIAPHFAQLATMYGDRAIFCKVDTDESKSLSQAANVTALPTFVFYCNGAETDRMKGANTNGLDQKVQLALAASAGSVGSSSGERKEIEEEQVDLSHMTRYESTSHLHKAMATIRSYNEIFIAEEVYSGAADTTTTSHEDVDACALSDDDMSCLEQLVQTLSKNNMWHASTIEPNQVTILAKVLHLWPYKYSLPLIDVARVMVLHPDGLSLVESNGTTIPWLLCHHALPTQSSSSSSSSRPASPNGGVALKCLSNIINTCTLQRRSVGNHMQQYLIQVCTSNIASNDRRTREALTSLMLNTTLNVLTFHKQTVQNMSPIIGVVCLLLSHEGKCKDATGMLVVKKCLSALGSIAKHGAETCQQWLVLGNAVTTIRSSDYTINQLKKRLLDTIARLAQREQSGISQAPAIPNPWA